MTRSDYNLIAQALHDSRPRFVDFNTPAEYDIALDTWTRCVGKLCVALKRSNPLLDSEGFIIACERGLQRAS